MGKFVNVVFFARSGHLEKRGWNVEERVWKKKGRPSHVLQPPTPATYSNRSASTMVSRRHCHSGRHFLLVLLFLALLLTAIHAVKTKPKKAPAPKKKRDSSYSNKGKRFFWLIDPRDNTCLGALGFGMCDGSTAWVFADRREGNVLISLLENDNSDMCLERKWCHSSVSPVSIGSCKNCGSKHWYVLARRERKGGGREE